LKRSVSCCYCFLSICSSMIIISSTISLTLWANTRYMKTE
jgi:hypothetical protein